MIYETAPQNGKHEGGLYLFYFIKKVRGEANGLMIDDAWTCAFFAPSKIIAKDILDRCAKEVGLTDQIKAFPTNMVSHFFCVDWIDGEIARMEDFISAVLPKPKVADDQMALKTDTQHVLGVVKNALMKKIIETKDSTLLFQNRAQFTEAELLYIDEKMK